MIGAKAREIGLLVKRWRKGRGLNRVEMHNELSKLGVDISYGYLSKLESGGRDLGSASIEIREGIRQVLGISRERWQEETGLHVPLRTSPEADPVRSRGIMLDWIALPVYHTASAGTGQPEALDGEEIVVPREVLLQRGVALNDVMPLRINGDCLVSQKVRFSTKNIAHGDYVLVDLASAPSDGDTILAYDKHSDQLIVKFWKEDNDDYVVLYDARGISIARPKDDPELVFRGVVFYRMGGTR